MAGTRFCRAAWRNKVSAACSLRGRPSPSKVSSARLYCARALPCSVALPNHSAALSAVAIDALAGKVHQPERHLRRRIAFFCRFLVPASGGRKVLLHPVTIGVEDAEPELGSGAALSGGERIPVPSFLIIVLATDPPRVNQPGIGLRVGDPLLGRRPAPTQRLGRVLRDVEPVRKEQCSIVVGGLGVALGRGTIPSRKARRLAR